MVEKRSTGPRGSAKLIGRGVYEPEVFTKKHLSRFINISRNKGVKLVDWCVFGTPAIDGVCGRYQVDPTVALTVIKELVNIKDIRIRFDYFPYGVPYPPDGAFVSFRAGTVAGVVITDG